VVDASNGDLYGHVVAGHMDGRVAFITPAHKVFVEIRKRLGAPELLHSTKPSPPDASDASLSPIHIDKKPLTVSRHDEDTSGRRPKVSGSSIWPRETKNKSQNSDLDLLVAPNIRGNTQELLQLLNDQHRAYLDGFAQIIEITNSPDSQQKSTSLQDIQPARIRKRTRLMETPTDVDNKSIRTAVSSTLWGSTLVGSSQVLQSSDEDEDEGLYVEEPFPASSIGDEDLRGHLRTHRFNEYGHNILDSVISSQGTLLAPRLFTEEERQQLPHYQVFSVDADGAPLPHIVKIDEDSSITQSERLWRTIKASVLGN